MTEALLVIHASVDGEQDWHPIKAEEVPAWVKHPDVMACMVAGNVVQQRGYGEAGSLHYRAERVPS